MKEFNLNLKKRFQNFKVITVKFYCNFLILGYGGFPVPERIASFIKTAFILGPIAFGFEILEIWFETNQSFTAATLFMILLNMVFGGIMHFKKGDFDWQILIIKTVLMTVVVLVTYFVLEVIISFAGSGLIINGFRAALQVATLLYPGAKVIKHVFILSDGEHPPKWIIHRIYNFKDNGDLQAFVEGRPDMAPPPRRRWSENNDLPDFPKPPRDFPEETDFNQN
jgi:hypothetical protein